MSKKELPVRKQKIDEFGNQNINLATGGKSLKLDIHKAGDTIEQHISHEHINRMKKRMNLSQNQALILAQELRVASSNRKIIPSDLKSFLKEKNNEFSDIFEYENVDGEEVIFCFNVAEHISTISRKRGHSEPKLIKIGLDGGQGTLKCAASYLYESDEIFDLSRSETPAKRRKYSEGLDASKFSNNNGVNRVQILSLSTDSEENYDKLKFMLDKLQLQPGSFLLCADLKVINISLNLMSHSARHPCPYCHWVKGSKTGDSTLRTFEGICEHAETWLNETGGDRDKLKNYFNCQGPPLTIFPTSGLVVDHIPLSELHIMMGVTNKLVDELIKVWDDAVDWPKQLHLLRENYHKGFEGNQCRALLKKVEVLEKLVEDDCEKHSEKVMETHPAKVFIDALKALNELVAGCFGKSLCSDYVERIQIFSEKYDQCKISITSKAHAIKSHLKPFLDKHNVGLSLFSEQAFEAIHSKFLQIWAKYKIKDKSNPNFFEALFRAVLDFNGGNII